MKPLTDFLRIHQKSFRPAWDACTLPDGIIPSFGCGPQVILPIGFLGFLKAVSVISVKTVVTSELSSGETTGDAYRVLREIFVYAPSHFSVVLKNFMTVEHCYGSQLVTSSWSRSFLACYVLGLDVRELSVYIPQLFMVESSSLSMLELLQIPSLPVYGAPFDPPHVCQASGCAGLDHLEAF